MYRVTRGSGPARRVDRALPEALQSIPESHEQYLSYGAGAVKPAH